MTTTLKASYYGDAGKDAFNPSNQTSSGEYYRSDRADNAASPVYPDGTKLLVWHPTSKKALLIRINNAGPYWGDRKLDLSRAAAEKLGFVDSGVATLQVRVVAAPSKAEATYKHGRSYPAVQGYLGQFANLEAASANSGVIQVAAAEPAQPAPARMATREPKAPATDALLVNRVSPSLSTDDGGMPRLVAMAAQRALQELPKFAALR